MAESNLIIETGEKVLNANSYVSIDDADQYFNARNNSSWKDATTPAKETALIIATQYIDGKYRKLWKGIKSHYDQSLLWPRLGILIDGYSIASDSIPKILKDAVCEAAVRSLSAPLADDLQNGIKMKNIAGIVTKSFTSHSGEATMRYQIIDNLLSDLLRNSTDLILA